MNDICRTCRYGEGLGERPRTNGGLDGLSAHISASRSRTVAIATRFVVRLVACTTHVGEAEMLGGQRGGADVARARQIAMYLIHTSLSVAYGDVAGVFGRDRTTVSHACKIVEDLRDDPMQDEFIASLEETVELARSMAATPWETLPLDDFTEARV